MTTKKRVETVRILIATHSGLSHSPKLSDIVGELNRVLTATRVPKHNGWLLGLLHTTRALDTSLRELLIQKGWFNSETGLGGYLTNLEKRSVLTAAEHVRWRRSIADVRNKVMHTAGEMPTQLQSDAVLSEMEACLVIVLART